MERPGSPRSAFESLSRVPYIHPLDQIQSIRASYCKSGSSPMESGHIMKNRHKRPNVILNKLANN